MTATQQPDPAPVPVSAGLVPVPPLAPAWNINAVTFLAVAARLGHVPTVKQCISFAQSQWRDPAADTKGMVGHRDFMYAKLEEYLEQVRLHLNSLGCTLLQPWSTFQGEDERTWFRLTTTITGPAGDEIREVLEIPIPDGATVKDLGGHGTFCRRYSCMAILGFGKDEDTDSDPDVTAQHAGGRTALPPPQRRQSQPRGRAPQRARNLDEFERQAPAQGKNPPAAQSNGQPAAQGKSPPAAQGNGQAPAQGKNPPAAPAESQPAQGTGQTPPPLPRLEKVSGQWRVRATRGAHARDRITVTSPRTGEQREVELVRCVGCVEDDTEDWVFSEALPAAPTGQTAQEKKA